MSIRQWPSLNFDCIQRDAPTSTPLDANVSSTRIWGWVVYRTAYAPQTHDRWEEFKKRLDELILFDFEDFHYAADPGSVNVARERYRTFVLEDEELFKDASPDDLEVHFQKFTEESPDIDSHGIYSATWKAFLIADEKAIDSILAAPVQDKSVFQETGTRMQDYAITVVARKPEPDDVYYDEETGEEYYPDEPEYVQVDMPPSWPGHIQASVLVLYALWEELSGAETLLEDIHNSSSFKLQGGVWTGGW